MVRWRLAWGAWRLCQVWMALGLYGCTVLPPRNIAVGAPSGRERLREIHARLGTAALDNGEWGQLDTPAQVALDFAEGAEDGWLRLETGFHLGQDESGGVLPNGDIAEEGLTTFELSGGLLAAMADEEARLRPYVGAGLSALYAESDLITQDELAGARDGALGAYGKVGLLLRVRTRGYLGIEARYLEASDIETARGERDIGGLQLSLVFGASF